MDTQTFSAFDSAGISTQMFTDQITVGGKPGYLHAKAIVVDESRAWMGSINGSTESLTNNREFGVFFNDVGDVGTLLAQLQADQTDPHGESWKDSLDCAKDNQSVSDSFFRF